MKVICTSILVLTILGLFTTAQRAPKLLKELWDDTAKPFKEGCIAETGVNPQYADRIFLYSEFINDRALMCYLACIAQNVGILNASGEWDKDIFVQRAAGTTPAMFNSCNEETKAVSHVCERSMAMAMCIVRHVSTL
ncbi:hypothetical protein PPYR_11036 [Photinus pyralis]|uniref:Uncharacterized protein n=1 Tax=Photinus pyralis TaxID=7054 RepID=A0A1Y1LJB1_PHOPY|nr:hypothetical protein PPYR_11036 [Photinus pyralis]